MKNQEEIKVLVQNNELYMDSREVAEMIGKRHANLVRDIDNYSSVISTNSKLSSLDYFVPSIYKDKKGESRKHYLLTKKGCDMVANKMTGEKGILFTATYIDAFYEMEKQIKGNEHNLPTTFREALLLLADVEEKREQLELKVKEDKPKLDYYNTVLKSTDSLLATQIAKDYGMSAQKFNKTLNNLGVQYNSRGQWVLYHKYQSEGYTTTETNIYIKPNGTKGSKNQTVWTQEGRLFLYGILKDNNILPDIEK